MSMNNEENSITAPMHLSLLDKQDLCDETNVIFL